MLPIYSEKVSVIPHFSRESLYKNYILYLYTFQEIILLI